ncbi:hypothetical protein NEOLEDRAFT_1129450, partial [Neolentinus lepideus HHB14362 ss-1]
MIPSIIQGLQSSIGYDFIAYGLAMMFVLYGISILQVYFYYMTYPEDRRLIKLYVRALITRFSLDTACMGMVSHALYVLLVDRWGNISGLLTFPKTFTLEYMISCIITFMVQCWFAQRVYMVSKWRYRLVPPCLIMISALIALVAGVVFSIRLIVTGTTVFNIEETRFAKICVLLGHSSATVSDILITGALCTALHSRKTPELNRIKSARAQLNLLVIYAINRGVLTIIFQILHFTTYIALLNNGNWMLWHLMEGRVYVNSTLAMLNARQYLRKHRLNGVNTVQVSGVNLDTSSSSIHEHPRLFLMA